VVPLLVDEETSQRIEQQLLSDPEIVVWYGTPIECYSALTRTMREGGLDPEMFNLSVRKLDQLSKLWYEVAPTDTVRDRARRLLRLHPLRAADALQLAAAIVFTGENPRLIDFLSQDQRLSEAAEREGFHVDSLPL
jgi:predicted nucleic acid-binding protein